MSDRNASYKEPMMYNVSLPSYNSSNLGQLDSLKTNVRAGSHDHSMRSEMSSKNSGNDFMPQSISHWEGSVYQMRIEQDSSSGTAKFDFKVSARDQLLLRMSWDILLREYLPHEELKIFQALLYSNRNIASTERPFLNTTFDGMITKTIDPAVKARKGKKKGNDDKIDTALFCSQFYDNLIAMDPLLEEYFPSLRHQAVSFCKVLNSAIENLEDVHVLDDYIVKLGKRHSRILGIKTVGFEVMGKAFMTTLQDRFGSFLTLELKNLWGKLYSYLANCMITAGKDPMEKTKSDSSYQEESVVLSFPVPKLATHDMSTIDKLQLARTKNATTPNSLTQIPTNKTRSEMPLENISNQTKSDNETSSSFSPKRSGSTRPSTGSSTVVENSIKKNSYEEKIHSLQKTAQQNNCSIM
ncbi:hypothetical protein SMKI_14G0980 [Saccharomyces mikatae IFO 1815]|uniref:Globin domain-containing protein n=1 Tax=Saccharomyces mikatae IFO 1815 TaxID=226126 RepID=A0AA35IUA3_SACMI|nr:uncharacterized protein SMKI_14G0980 [Saccharomyces mikatae IFO 1815]CAI4035889.1 hypothetical protein SMKI_14G0980 [Saccharomyces mikatae IFO 1815]